ncbi:MAG: prolipoprotein diacylglyceryl transferase [Bacteroidales bacterium]|nr:prolipoprotein diacylglyceryl transferase [Bacteroidales bacterium]
MLAYIDWNVAPQIFHLGSWEVRWYGLLFASSFFFGYILMAKFFKMAKLPENTLDRLATYMLIGTVVGARLGHIFFYEPDYYFAHPIKMLYIWEGGLASHGAAIGILIALGIFAYYEKLNYFWVTDRIAIVVALAGFFIRMGNLMNSEIFGHVTTLPWGFKFYRAFPAGTEVLPHHPTQIYEGLSYLLLFVYLIWYFYKKQGKPAVAYLTGIWMIVTWGARFLIEFIKENQVDFEANMTLNMGQWLSIPLIILGFYLVYYSKKQRAK